MREAGGRLPETLTLPHQTRLRGDVVDFSFLEPFWSVLVIYALFVPIMILFSIVRDLSSRSGAVRWGKASWLLIAFPLVGILLYVIIRPQGMMERAVAQRNPPKAVFDTYVRDAARSGGPAQQIASAKSLLDRGAISEDEFATLQRPQR